MTEPVSVRHAEALAAYDTAYQHYELLWGRGSIPGVLSSTSKIIMAQADLLRAEHEVQAAYNEAKGIP